MHLLIGSLEVDPETWGLRDDFFQALEVVKAFKVVNDHAERRDSTHLRAQWVTNQRLGAASVSVQVVKDHRRSYPDSSKQSLIVAIE